VVVWCGQEQPELREKNVSWLLFFTTQPIETCLGFRQKYLVTEVTVHWRPCAVQRSGCRSSNSHCHIAQNRIIV